MALTTTTLNGTITAGVKTLTLAAFTNPATTFGSNTLLIFASGERCLVTNIANSPTLDVVRGYQGTPSTAHTTNEGVQYGLDSDPAIPATTIFGQVLQPVQRMAAQEITITGATGTTAGIVTPASFAFLNATGTSGAGLNLPVPSVGDFYWVKNNTTGVCKVYSVGSTINGTTGTTAISISATGTLVAGFACATAAAWHTVPAAT